jgi:N-acetylmuramoyl-L-alanine amidase
MARYTTAQWIALADLVKRLRGKYNPALEPALTSVQVLGHRDLSPDANGDGKVTSIEWLKTCPGFDVTGWLQRAMQPLPCQVCEMPV